MSKKDFELIAKILRQYKPGKMEPPCSSLQLLEQWEKMVATFANYLSDTNQRFNRERFINACD